MANVTIDTFAKANGGNGITSLGVAITIAAGHTNLALVVMTGSSSQTTGQISSVTGGGATWGSPSNGVGNGTYEGGCCIGTAPSTGSQTITVNWAGTTTQSCGLAIYSLYNVNQSTPGGTPVFAIASPITVSGSTSGDLILFADFDTNNNQTLSGTGITQDQNAFGQIGTSSAHNDATSAHNACTVAAFTAQSVGVGVNIKQLAAGGSRGLFEQNPMTGLGVGGSFFPHPIGRHRQPQEREWVRKDRIFVPRHVFEGKLLQVT